IGLTLVKRLVELHGGSVAASSNGTGHGSEFVVRLPIVAAALAGPPQAEEPPAEAPGPCPVPLDDDNQDAAPRPRAMLDLLGYETRRAYDGLAGLEVAAAFHPDVALLDIGMPGMNGYELACRVRREPWGKDAVLIAVTGWGQAEDKQRTTEA